MINIKQKNNTNEINNKNFEISKISIYTDKKLKELNDSIDYIFSNPIDINTELQKNKNKIKTILDEINIGDNIDVRNDTLKNIILLFQAYLKGETKKNKNKYKQDFEIAIKKEVSEMNSYEKAIILVFALRETDPFNPDMGWTEDEKNTIKSLNETTSIPDSIYNKTIKLLNLKN